MFSTGRSGTLTSRYPTLVGPIAAARKIRRAIASFKRMSPGSPSRTDEARGEHDRQLLAVHLDLAHRRRQRCPSERCERDCGPLAGPGLEPGAERHLRV